MKVAFVTGSSRGIGRGIADLLRENGYTVVYSGTRAQRPDDLPATCDYIGCNIAEREDYGRLDLAVNNAGVAPLVRRDLLEMDEESFDRVIGINLKGTMFMCQAQARAMLAGKESGLADYAPRIVNVGSISASPSSIARVE